MRAIDPSETPAPASAPARHLYLASRLSGEGDDDLSRLLADLPRLGQLTVRHPIDTMAYNCAWNIVRGCGCCRGRVAGAVATQ